MENPHVHVVEHQFGPRARAYVESAVHASGEDLDALAALLTLHPPRQALDLGCGGGHVSYLMAGHATSVTACDLSNDMLAAVEATARDRGITNLETCAARAERLPFDDARFDFVACRYSAHHWGDVIAGLREARRVSCTGASAVFIDACSPGTPLLDTHLQTVEILRDPSHVRDYSLAEWIAMLGQSGFAVEAIRTWNLRMDFDSWTARMRTPDLNKRMIQQLQSGSADEVQRQFSIEPDGSFLLPVLMVEARATR
jgi:ubiquinone/menaquinone biosynthesis C-methylase UbiE